MSRDDGLEVWSPAYNFAISESNVLRSIAGPGSWKSFAITRKIMKLIEDNVDPSRILAVTFTRTAARDLKSDIHWLDIEWSEKVIAKTLHSFALEILNQSYVIEQLWREPRIMLDHEREPALYDLSDSSFWWKSERKDLMKWYVASWATEQRHDPINDKTETQKQFENSFINWMKLHHWMLIDEVIPMALEFLTLNPLNEYIGKYDVILVDEYQDLNKAEQELINIIKKDAQLIIVWDDDQSIYSFKYAHPEWIREIANRYSDCEDILFENCYRCPKTVTYMASDLIKNNTWRILWDLIPLESNPDGEVEILQWHDLDQEVKWIVKKIKSEIDSWRILAKDILLLCPRRKIWYKFKNALLLSWVLAKTYFREDAMKEKVVQEMFSLMNLFANNGDDMISLRFLLWSKSRSTFLNWNYRKILWYSRESWISIKQTLDYLLEWTIDIAGTKKITERYAEILEELIKIKNQLLKAPQDLIQIFEDAGDQESLSELNELYLYAIGKYWEEEAFDVSKQSERFKTVFDYILKELTNPILIEEDHVKIMTLHSSKWLSSKFVIVASMISDLMPSLHSTLSDSEKEKCVEEQRRLFYVAITRCKWSEEYPGKLIISSFINIPAWVGLPMWIPKTANSASRFILDLWNKAPKPKIWEI